MKATEFSRWLHRQRNPERAAQVERFFQVFPGGYAEHDRFLGIAVPKLREGVKLFRGIQPAEIVDLVRSPWHEERMVGLLCWVDAFSRSQSEATRQEIVELYLTHRGHIDNWDLVDCSSHLILGPWWETHPNPELFQALVESSIVWDRRIAVLSTYHGIRHGQPRACWHVCESLLNDRHDLIHKATGWMLREAGKRDLDVLHDFLHRHCLRMPRTMLRYSIEKLPEEERRKWLAKR
ncbi:MAG: DNA alkylation repair protein [Fibrobacterota bacterium]|nr:DNA alkylation repair protein [Fibrobacterota bacterium]QQS03074.1 MAG: DNA alkylation repair protein [Fibrobacterota bacterium]